MYITQTLYTNIVPSLFFVFFPFVHKQTQLSCIIHSLTSVCAHRTRIEQVFGLQSCFQRMSVVMTSHMVVDTSLDYKRGSGAQLVEAAGSAKPQIHKESCARESAYVRDFVGRCSQVHSEYEYGECVVDMHVLPIKGTAQVKFKVVDGTEPTLSMTMLVVNGNKLVFRGENARLIMAKGETAPLASIENGWNLKVLINDNNEFICIDLWTPCHVCPPSWVRNLSPEMKQREQYVVRETTTIGMWDYETVTKPKDNSSPEQTGAVGETRNTEMLGDVEEPNLAVRRDGHFVTVSR